MLRARALLLPSSHILNKLLNQAATAVGFTWETEMKALMSRLCCRPDITEYFSLSDLEELQLNRERRKKALSRDMEKVVSPAMQTYDDDAFQRALNASPWIYESFQTRLEPLPQNLLECSWEREVWNSYRTWAAVRATGRLPLQLYGSGGLPYSIPGG